MSDTPLYFLPLGGSGEIGMNMNLYAYGEGRARQWIMIDCGVMFGDAATPGVDLICPDPAYILERKESLLGLVLTHGHEDHIGATAILARDLGCPLYATPFTAALVQRKLTERGIDDVPLHVIDVGARFSLGVFDLEYVTLTHSIPEPHGVVIRTPAGVVFHTGDWKIDPDPAHGPLTDAKTLTALGDEGVLAMICDSTNVFSPGESGSEAAVRDNLVEVIAQQKGRVAVTTFASNLARVLSVCDAARANDRSVCLLGRSMLRIVDVAQEVGLAPKTLNLVDPKDAGYLPREHVLYLCTGSQGEPRAALARIARDDHPDLTLSDGDTVIFSSKIIPGNEREIYDLQNKLVDLGVLIITEKDAFVHVSGHPCRDELKRMYGWVRPRFSIPVHGEARHLEEHADYALSLGAADSLAPRNGDLIRIDADGPVVEDEVPAGRLHLDGARLLVADAEPLRERRRLAATGAVSVSVVVDDKGRLASDPAVALVGGPRIGADGEDVAALVQDAVEDAFDTSPRGRRDDAEGIEILVRQAVRPLINEAWGKRPAVAVLIHRV
ncbi:MAG: ribonuclease J [Pseudomonadota bacterium]